jgi:death-on-curing protein
MRNHPLPDGNRRVALVMMDVYLDEHGLCLRTSAEDVDRTFRAVAAGRMSETDLAGWLRGRVERA